MSSVSEEEKALSLEKEGVDKADSALALVYELRVQHDAFFANIDKSKDAREQHIQACKALVEKYKPEINRLRSTDFERGIYRFLLGLVTCLSFGTLLAVPKIRQTLFTDKADTQIQAEKVINANERNLQSKP